MTCEVPNRRLMVGVGTAIVIRGSGNDLGTGGRSRGEAECPVEGGGALTTADDVAVARALGGLKGPCQRGIHEPGSRRTMKPDRRGAMGSSAACV